MFPDLAAYATITLTQVSGGRNKSGDQVARVSFPDVGTAEKVMALLQSERWPASTHTINFCLGEKTSPIKPHLVVTPRLFRYQTSGLTRSLIYDILRLFGPIFSIHIEEQQCTASVVFWNKEDADTAVESLSLWRANGEHIGTQLWPVHSTQPESSDEASSDTVSIQELDVPAPTSAPNTSSTLEPVIHDPCRLFCTVLPLKMDNMEFRKLFEDFGYIISAEVYNNNRRRGYAHGIITFWNRGDALRAVDALNGTLLGKRKIRVQLHREDNREADQSIKNERQEEPVEKSKSFDTVKEGETSQIQPNHNKDPPGSRPDVMLSPTDSEATLADPSFADVDVASKPNYSEAAPPTTLADSSLTDAGVPSKPNYSDHEAASQTILANADVPSKTSYSEAVSQTILTDASVPSKPSYSEAASQTILAEAGVPSKPNYSEAASQTILADAGVSSKPSYSEAASQTTVVDANVPSKTSYSEAASQTILADAIVPSKTSYSEAASQTILADANGPSKPSYSETASQTTPPDPSLADISLPSKPSYSKAAAAAPPPRPRKDAADHQVPSATIDKLSNLLTQTWKDEADRLKAELNEIRVRENKLAEDWAKELKEKQKRQEEKARDWKEKEELKKQNKQLEREIARLKKDLGLKIESEKQGKVNADAAQKEIHRLQVEVASLRHREEELEDQVRDLTEECDSMRFELNVAEEMLQSEAALLRRREEEFEKKIGDLTEEDWRLQEVMKSKIEDLDRQLMLSESRRKMLELEADRPKWEEAKRKREAAEKEAREKEEQRKRQKEIEELERKEREEMERKRAAEEKKRKEEEKRRKEEEERKRRELEAKLRKEKAWKQATATEVRRCQDRDRILWTSWRWSNTSALSRFKHVMDEFESANFSTSTPMTVLSIPWPVLKSPFQLDVEDVQWDSVETFFETVRQMVELSEYKALVERSHKMFHPDRWRARNLLNSVMLEEERCSLEKAGNIVSQALTPIWRNSRI
ncbi:hypothetical protein VKT23_010562 [Stygiomarasmius scandens]|uniref:RRM domain-containing protein n=1 Tax=Marasmiellus scandens TaxID=2682957 RepID=A0ABR1JC10_9AGAR